MFTLTFKSPDGSEQTAELERELTVGREETNDVVLPDGAVSRHHCRFFVDGKGRVLVEDKGSSNGVVVNGERIAAPTPISDDAEVYVAEWQVQLARSSDARPPVKRRGANGPSAKPKVGGNGAANKAPTRQFAVTERPGQPKALAKTNNPARTRRMAAVEAPAKKAPLARAAPASSSSAGSLKGQTGPWAGKVFSLARPLIVLGRGAGADVVVDDDSVSRRHLEIRKQAGGYLLRDLGSANGTFVNGESVSEALLANGDEIRVGVVEFVYSGPGAPRERRAGGAAAKRKRLIILGAAGAGLLLVIVAVAVAGGSPPPPPQPIVADNQDDPTRDLVLCKLYADPDATENNWEKAVETCGRVLKVDPLNIESTRLLKLSKREVEFERIFKEGKKLAELGREEDAIDKFVMVEPGSSFFRRARALFLQQREIVTKREKTDCRTYGKSGLDWCKAAEHCGKFLVYDCCQPNPDFKDDVAAFERANKLCRKSTSWTCPNKFGRHCTSTDPGSAEARLRSEFEAKYRDAEVVNAMMVYAIQGKPRRAADDLKRLLGKPRGVAMEATLKELIANLEILDGRYASGQPLAANQPERAEEYLNEAVEADKKLMPVAEPSELHKQIRSILAKGYLGQASQRYQQNRIDDAARFIQKAYGWDKSDTDVIDLANKIELEADRYLNQGCVGLEKARKLLRDASPKMRIVEERSRKLGCQ